MLRASSLQRARGMQTGWSKSFTDMEVADQRRTLLIHRRLMDAKSGGGKFDQNPLRTWFVNVHSYGPLLVGCSLRPVVSHSRSLPQGIRHSGGPLTHPSLQMHDQWERRVQLWEGKLARDTNPNPSPTLQVQVQARMLAGRVRHKRSSLQDEAWSKAEVAKRSQQSSGWQIC